MRIYLNNLNESWVVDKLKKEWIDSYSQFTTNKISNSDIVWIIAPWLWKKIPRRHLKRKKVICSIYHIDFSKFDENQENEFILRDSYVDQYHVISEKTKHDLKKLTQKKIISIPFWVNQNKFFSIENKADLRSKFGFSEKDILIGSFQRDTEGSDLVSPKLIKGPDILFNILDKEFKKNPNTKVVLAGKRRQFIIGLLEKNNIPYKYFEMVDEDKLNLLYNILDLYIVSSRLEGGPQAIIECAISKTPIISTNVGVSPEILSSDSIFNSLKEYEYAKPNIEFAYNNAKKYTLKKGMKLFEEMFRELYEN